MKRRPFRNTGLQVSELILGAGCVGGIILRADDETHRTLMRRLLENGINWIDTAESYRQVASEEALGWLLAELSHLENALSVAVMAPMSDENIEDLQPIWDIGSTN